MTNTNNGYLIELLSCKICLNPYDENLHKPLSIYPCGHTYCLACLEQLITQTCPECRTYIDYNVDNWEILRLINSNILHASHNDDSDDDDENNVEQEQQPLLINRASTMCCQCSNSLKSFVNRSYTKISNLTTSDKLLLAYFIFIALPILLVYPMALTIIGIKDDFQCNIDQRIPAWTIAYGCGGVLLVLIFIGLKIYYLFKPSVNERSQCLIRMAYTCSFLLALFELVWFFVGCVWIFGTYANVKYDDATSVYFCQPGLFKFAFGTLVFQCIVFGLVAIIYTCVMLRQ